MLKKHFKHQVFSWVASVMILLIAAVGESTQLGLGALRVFVASALPFIVIEDLVKGSIVHSTSEPKHGAAIDHIPPRAGSLHADMANEFIG